MFEIGDAEGGEADIDDSGIESQWNEDQEEDPADGGTLPPELETDDPDFESEDSWGDVRGSGFYVCSYGLTPASMRRGNIMHRAGPRPERTRFDQKADSRRAQIRKEAARKRAAAKRAKQKARKAAKKRAAAKQAKQKAKKAAQGRNR